MAVWPLFIAALFLTAGSQLLAETATNSLVAANVAPTGHDTTLSVMRDVIEQFSTDLNALQRYHNIASSESRTDRLRRFYTEETDRLDHLDFAALDQDGRIDYLLLKNQLRFELAELRHDQQKLGEISTLVPFSKPIIELEEARRRMEPNDPELSAKVLNEVDEQVANARKAVEKQLKSAKESDSTGPGKVAANRAAREVGELRGTLQRWHEFYSGYDPEFTWWADQPFQKLDKDLQDYASFLRKKLAGFSEEGDDPIIGDPIGREALFDALEREMIPYTPEELIDLANQEFAWCEKEMHRASQELGFGDDWHKALEHVSHLHVKAGEQPKLIRDLSNEAIKFVEDHDLVTIPPLCKEIWRMEMMTAERQKVNPYFTGGEVISVSYPTASMGYEDKEMSMRGNNIPFSHATVFHEVIPGHHLQGYMASRYKSYRRVFRTPFVVEGWALYWEMLLWDMNFHRTPEERVGALFWRAHRCARIIFSLNFHLGKMTPQQAIDFLVDRVGHERRNATAEVRRSFAGDYSPLYQAAYMLGGLQIRSLHHELVESGKLSAREFHDAILKENMIPIEMIRARLTGQSLSREFKSSWRFYNLETSKRADATPAAPADRPAGAIAASAAAAENTPPRPKVYRDKIEPHWFASNNKFWYRLDLPDDRRQFILVNATNGTRLPAFDHEQLAQALTIFTHKPTQADHLPVSSIRFADDLTTMELIGESSDWTCDLQTYSLTPSKTEKPSKSGESAPTDSQRRRSRARLEAGLKSPDGKWEALARGHNLFLRETANGKEQALTYNGDPDNSYARDVQRDRAIDMQYDAPDPEAPVPEVYWSPDSRRLVAIRTRAGTQRRVYLVESSPADQLQPKLDSYPYLKPGDEIPLRKPHLFDVETKREIPVDDALFSNPWSLSDLQWDPDSSRFNFLYNQRGHQVLRVVAVDGLSGEAKAVIDEQSKTFIDYAGKFFSESVPASGEIIWMSERDGWNHLYLYDARAGQVKRQITKGEWVVRGVDRVDREKRQIWFHAGGLYPGQDPYYIQYCRVNFDGSDFTRLTDADGTHAAQFSPDHRFLIDTWSRVDQPPITELRRCEDGQLLCKLEEADASQLFASGWKAPERFVAKGRDGVTDICGIIVRPKDFDATKKYPIIESIYAGPQDSFVPKAFRPTLTQSGLADLGFVVVQIDGMGTSNRSKKFHDVCWKNLGDAGFPDRILWIKAAAEKYPSLDLSRVGIYGTSAGGQNALRGLLAHGDFYKAGVADSGCHDNRMDKIWWNELWMGWPIGPHYDEQSNVTQASRLTGKLMLMVGEMDKNVDPASTMQVVNALIKANKDFDLVVMPGRGHGVAGTPYGRHRLQQFFVRTLLESGASASARPVASLAP